MQLATILEIACPFNGSLKKQENFPCIWLKGYLNINQSSEQDRQQQSFFRPYYISFLCQNEMTTFFMCQSQAIQRKTIESCFLFSNYSFQKQVFLVSRGSWYPCNNTKLDTFENFGDSFLLLYRNNNLERQTQFYQRGKFSCKKYREWNFQITFKCPPEGLCPLDEATNLGTNSLKNCLHQKDLL